MTEKQGIAARMAMACAVGRLKDMPELPCGSPEMTPREYEIYLAGCHAVGALMFIRRVLEDAFGESQGDSPPVEDV